MGKTTSCAVAALLAAASAIGTNGAAYAAESNPVDEVSNPAAFDYNNVGIDHREMDETFIREGMVTEPQLFAGITPGLGQAQVQALLGSPLRQEGREWEYNFKLRMEQSENFLVCQYKVVFDEQQLVRETVWRRRQCQQLAGAGAS